MVSERGAAAAYGEAEGGCGLAVMPEQEDLSMEVRHLSARISSLTHEVGTIEARQVALDRRLVEFGGLVQGLQEEQYTQSCALKQSQKTLACGAQRALDTAFAVQRQMEEEDAWETCMERMGGPSAIDHGSLQELERRWEARLEEHTRWLMDLQSDIAAMTLEGPAAVQSSVLARQSGAPGAEGVGPIGARISALEKGQRTVAVSARRALQTAIIVHRQQQSSQEHEEVSEKDDERRQALEDLVKPVTELEQQCSHRFTAQEERMDKILQMVDTLADRVLMQGRALPDGDIDGEHLGGASGAAVVTETLEVVNEMREKMDDLEANVYGLASQLQALQQQAQQQGGFGFSDVRPDGGVTRESFIATVESLEARVDRSLGEVDRSLAEVCQRLDSLQEGRDQQRLTLRQMGNELPEVSQKLDQLWSQCQYYFPRVKEHDVHFSFFRTSFENHKQHMLDFTDGLDHGCLSDRSSRTASNPVPAFKPPSPFGGGDRLGSGLAGGGLGLGVGGGGLGLGGLSGGGLGAVAGLGAGAGGGAGAAAANGADEGPKARMLAQVMARLYADSDSGLSGRGQAVPE